MIGPELVLYVLGTALVCQAMYYSIALERRMNWWQVAAGLAVWGSGAAFALGAWPWI